MAGAPRLPALAHAAGADPVEFRVRHMSDPRGIAVLKAAVLGEVLDRQHHLPLHHEVSGFPEQQVRDPRLRRKARHHEACCSIRRGLEGEGPDSVSGTSGENALRVRRRHQDHGPLRDDLAHDHPRHPAEPVGRSHPHGISSLADGQSRDALVDIVDVRAHHRSYFCSSPICSGRTLTLIAVLLDFEFHMAIIEGGPRRRRRQTPTETREEPLQKQERPAFRPPSIVFRSRAWSSEELAAVAAGWLDILHASIPPTAGLIAMLMSNHPEAVALFFALSSFPLPVIVLPPDPRAWRSSPPLPAGTPLFVPPSLHALAAAGGSLGLSMFVLPEPRSPSAATGPVPFLACPGFVNFTSGSTGLPKPVYITTRSFLVQTAAIIEACPLSPGDPVAGSLQLATHYGLGQALFLPTVLGSPLGLLERFDPRSLLRLFASGPYAYWAATPLMADMLARAPLAASIPAAPPICHISAGRLSARTFQAFAERFGVKLRPGYGQTENGFITVDRAPEEEIRPDCVGRPAPGIEVRIGDDPLDPYPSGRLGRVWFKSPWYMEGYGFPPRLAPREGRQGWWPTADMGVLDDAGYLTLAGRADDCFKTSAGYLVNPGEIANVLTSHPGVSEVVVIPVRNSEGPVIGAFVESDGAIDPDELRATAARMLPAWLRPQVVVVTGRLPRLAGGKVDREACHAVLREARGWSEPVSPRVPAPGG